MVIFLLSAAFSFRTPIEKAFTHDSALYFVLANNIVSDVGYYDTVRNDEILPPVGHPLLMSSSILLNVSPYFDRILVFLSFLFTGLAVWKYTKNIFLTIISEFIMFSIFKEIGFYKFGIETSGVFTSSMLIYSLTRLYKNKSKVDILFAAFSLLITILVRPTLLYLSIAIASILLIYMVLKYKKILFNYELLSYRLLAFLSASLIGILLVTSVSLVAYQDARLVRGTYAAMNLYLANNEYINPETPYYAAYSNNIPEEERKVLVNDAGWENRESILFSKTLEYITNNPRRSLKGWIWRFDRYIGNDYLPGNPLYPYRAAVWISVLLFIVEILLFLSFRKKQVAKISAYLLSTGISILLFLQIFQLVLFSWTGARYLTYLIPYLAAAIMLTAYDCWSIGEELE
jgi:hypothetical protein